jgi:hypothetical protein
MDKDIRIWSNYKMKIAQRARTIKFELRSLQLFFLHFTHLGNASLFVSR